MKKVGHNSGPTQKQNCDCESIHKQIKNKKQQYNHNSKIKHTYSFTEKTVETNWTQ